MRLWSVIIAAGALVSICVGAGVAVGILFGQRMAERDFCLDSESERFISDPVVRETSCK